MRFARKPPVRRVLTLLASAGLVVFAAVSCQGGGDGTTQRLSDIEDSVSDLSSVVSRVEALESSTDASVSQLTAISESITALQTSLDELSGRVSAATGSDAELSEKLDSVSAQLNTVAGQIDGLEQDISLLETRYNDHLRKYHDGG